MKIFCEYCGGHFEVEKANFCPNCGAAEYVTIYIENTLNMEE